MENELAQTLNTILSIFAFVMGALVGSFLNVCVYRLPRGESVVSPRSRCPQCSNPIAWYDNIPMVSWLILGAKCRHCGKVISWQYPLVEAITAVLFFGVFWRFGMTLASPIYMVLAASLVVVTFVDLTDWTIPNEITFPGIPLGILCALLGTMSANSGLHTASVFDSFLGVLLGGGILYGLDLLALLLLGKRGMGFGDVKLNAMLGAFFGWKGALLIIMLAAVLGTIFGVAMIILNRGKETTAPGNAEEGEEELKGHYLPFGPYLAVGGLIVMFIGPDQILTAYFEFFGVTV